ncbi:MAG: ATP phosphoribosyltransferase, partial [Aquificaceae bacterium]|nr:ATP phosphoribosyltransferase [Aquificaceae bacterium]
QDFFLQKGVRCKVVSLSGSVELAPLIGLADYIVDLTQTGRTLKENNLVVIEEIASSTAMLVCNRTSYRNIKEEVLELVKKFVDLGEFSG